MSMARPPPRGMRLLVTNLLLAILFGVGGAVAQKVQITGGVPVVFIPTADEIVAAIDCMPPDCLAPLPPATRLKIIRQKRENEPMLRASRTPWFPSDDLELYVRYVVDGNKSTPYTTDWFEIDTGVSELFGTDDPNTRVGVEYQLRIGPDAMAGSYQTVVTYDTGAGTGTATHLITFELVPVIMLRIDGAPVGTEATVEFDYALSPLPYLQAVTTGDLLPATGGDLARVEIFTNSPGGYQVAVTVVQLPNIDGNLFPPERLLLAGVPATSRVFVGSSATVGYETLLIAGDYLLAVDGAEEPGSYRMSLTFMATMVP